MKRPASLQLRIALGLGLALSLLLLGAGALTVQSLRHELQEVFDSVLAETAQRLLPLAVVEIVNRDEAAGPQSLAPIREHEEFFTYIVRDRDGTVLMRSHAADPTVFLPWDGPGFRDTATHRFYGEETLQGSIRLTVAEPLEHRQKVLGGILMRLALPLALVIPLTLAFVVLALRLGLGGLRRFRRTLAARDARDLSPVPTDGLPSELQPVADTVNSLLLRLSAAFEAERSFAANAAHELRTPLAGAIAQAQRLRAETTDAATAGRAEAIEETLKRLTRTAERLMQLARAEGGRLRRDHPADLRPILRVVVDDLVRPAEAWRLRLVMPDAPVMSDLDPDALAILCRNLIDNALRHGAQDTAVEVSLSPDAVLRVDNDGDIIPPETLATLTGRFTRAGGGAGSGLGLAIVAAFAARMKVSLTLLSPCPGLPGGLRAEMRLSLGIDPARGPAR